jgi:opacity protein-like surface antigen
MMSTMLMTRAGCTAPTLNRLAPLPPSPHRLLLPLLLVVAGVLLSPAPARAQQEYSFFAAYAGYTTGGDTTTAGPTFGFSTAYVTENNWGAELDVSHSTKFNDESYEATALTTAMINVLAIPRVSRWARPYAAFGVGAIRARGCTTNCVREFSRTDLGLDLAGGVFVPVNETFGARADVRYFRYAQIHNDLPRLDNGGFDFWRVTFGGVITW